MDTFAGQILVLINNARRDAGLSQLILNAQLNQAAQGHSQDIAINDLVVDHFGANGSTLPDRLTAAGYQYQAAVENVGAGHYTADEVFQDWITSPGHHANILNPTVSDLGAGHFFLANDTGLHNYYDYWTLVLGTRIPGTEPTVPVPSPVTPQPPVAPQPSVPQPPYPPATPAPPVLPTNPPEPSNPPIPEPVVEPPNPVPSGPVVSEPSVEEPLQPELPEVEAPQPNPVSPSLPVVPVSSPDELPPPTVPEPGFPAPVEPLEPTISLDITVIGNSSDEILQAGAGNDLIAGGLGNDQISGGDGHDLLRGDQNSVLPGGSEGGDDIIFGGAGNDRIGGKGGNDQLLGESGDDTIWGGQGDDILHGGLGNDTLIGDYLSANDIGADIFILAAGEGTDTILDFQLGIDTIDLAGGLTFTDLSLGQKGSSTTIELNGEILAELHHITATDLTSDMFTWT